jgi:hypothetical protein
MNKLEQLNKQFNDLEKELEKVFKELIKDVEFEYFNTPLNVYWYSDYLDEVIKVEIEGFDSNGLYEEGSDEPFKFSDFTTLDKFYILKQINKVLNEIRE